MSSHNGHVDQTLVPFGKYRGQPVEALLADRQYCDWLLAQPGFRDQRPNLYQVIINYGGAPQDTPEHNQLQARFIDHGLCLTLARAVADEGAESIKQRRFEVHGWDLVIETDADTCVAVELKPQIGDDYPSVLRQVLRYPHPLWPGGWVNNGRRSYYEPSPTSWRHRVVVVDQWGFTGVEPEDVRTIFQSQGVNIISLAGLLRLNDCSCDPSCRIGCHCLECQGEA